MTIASASRSPLLPRAVTTEIACVLEAPLDIVLAHEIKIGLALEPDRCVPYLEYLADFAPAFALMQVKPTFCLGG